ncbi:hypothetical protein [Ekhidna sp.]
MDQQKIDRLFREKLGHMEAAPSSKAWSQVEKQIRPKNTPVVYWVAASVSLLFISWFVWPVNSEDNFSPIALEANYPVNQQVINFELPVIKPKADENPMKNSSKNKVYKVQPKPQTYTQVAVANDIEIIEPEIEKDVAPEIMDIETKSAVAEAEVEKPVILDEVKEAVDEPSFRTVKITYIASSEKKIEETQKNDSTGVLKKFIALTGKLAPGDMLADIKTAKDNLLNGGLKNKKERSSL